MPVDSSANRLPLFCLSVIIGSAEALPIVREVRSVRERERDTERERRK